MKKRIEEALRAFVNGASVMTAAEFAKAWGYKDRGYAKRKYLDGLDCINGRYFIEDIVERIVNEVREHD